MRQQRQPALPPRDGGAVHAPHTFKGLSTDRFIGISPSTQGSTKAGKAFKEIWQPGINHNWAVIWVPVNELPADYLAEAHKKPNRSEKPQR